MYFVNRLREKLNPPQPPIERAEALVSAGEFEKAEALLQKYIDKERARYRAPTKPSCSLSRAQKLRDACLKQGPQAALAESTRNMVRPRPQSMGRFNTLPPPSLPPPYQTIVEEAPVPPQRPGVPSMPSDPMGGQPPRPRPYAALAGSPVLAPRALQSTETLGGSVLSASGPAGRLEVPGSAMPPPQPTTQRANHRFPAWSVDLAPAKDPMARSPGSESMSSVGSDSGTYHDNASGLSTSFSPRSVEFAETRLVVNRERFATARATVLAPKSPPSR